MRSLQFPMRTAALIASALLACGSAIAADGANTPSSRPASELAARGRYLVQTTGCNDCHTAGYAASGGKVAEKDWLTGDVLGFRGPWGTTYPANLRLLFNGMTEAQWLVIARSMQPRPPMPWFNVRAMTDEDLRAIYQYMKAAGPAGAPAPAFVPPGRTPKPPFVQYP